MKGKKRTKALSKSLPLSKSRVKPNKHKEFSSIVSPKNQAMSTPQTNNITNTKV